MFTLSFLQVSSIVLIHIVFTLSFLQSQLTITVTVVDGPGLVAGLSGVVKAEEDKDQSQSLVRESVTAQKNLPNDPNESPCDY